jgi:hypothetical protein
MDRALYSIEETRARLGGISRNSLYAMLRAGSLPSVVIGCRRFVSAEAITAGVRDLPLEAIAAKNRFSCGVGRAVIDGAVDFGAPSFTARIDWRLGSGRVSAA